MKQASDQELLTMLQSGNPDAQDEAFRQLYRQHYGFVEKFVTANSGGQDDAKDIFHDGVIVFFNNAKKEGFLLSSSLKTYLYSICRNQWLMRLRKIRREIHLDDHHEHIPLSDSFFDSLTQTETMAAVGEAMKKLGDDCRRLLELFYFNQMKMAKIMEEFNLASEQVAKNKKSLCMKKLRELVGKDL